MSEWISVKTKLPEIESGGYINKSKPVLTYGEEYGIEVMEYMFYDIDLGTVDNFQDDGITHWMPLPEPPKD